MKVGDLVQVMPSALEASRFKSERVGVIVDFKEFGPVKLRVVYIQDENGIQYVYRPESLRVIG
tara:strand:+ start:404 stop:592 length:189 start_codon:yes stop_codon:yes gene_type:complete